MQNRYLKSSIVLLLLFLITSTLPAIGQEDLLDMLEEDSSDKESQKVIATFKTTRIVNSHSIETVKAKHLDFRVTHHFGNIAGNTGGHHTFFGLDQAADIRIAFEYGVTENLTAGIGRSKVSELVDGYIKYRLLSQTDDNKKPLSITILANAGLSAAKIADRNYAGFENRLSYTTQVLIARKFSPSFSWQVMPTFLHRNYVPVHNDQNDMLAIGTGGRIKLTKRFALLADYYIVFSDLRRNNPSTYFPPLGLGVEIETGGHVFHLFFTNNAAIIENSYLANTTES